MTLSEAYRIFEIPRNSSLDDVKRKHRILVKQWHPDKFVDELQKEIAHHKISDINQASALLKRVKHTRNIVANETIRSTVSYKTQTQSNSSTSNKSTAKKKKVRYRVVNGPSRFDFLMGNLTSRQHIYFINKRSGYSKQKARQQAKIVDNRFAKKFEAFRAIYKIGFYKSYLNRALDHQNVDSKATGLGSYSLKSKYEAIVNYEQIKDVIFYSINRNWNVITKYIIGIMIVALMIRTILFNYYRGVAVYGIETFLMQELKFLVGFATLFVPDHLFQRVLLAKYHSMPASQVKKIFSNGKRIPSPWSLYFYALIISKLGFLIWLLI